MTYSFHSVNKTLKCKPVISIMVMWYYLKPIQHTPILPMLTENLRASHWYFLDNYVFMHSENSFALS